MKIHPTSIIEEGAEIGNDVSIGPYCIVGKNVKLEDNVELKSHIVVTGRTSIGEGTIIYPFASIGHDTPDKKYKGEESEIIIGKYNIIREHVTINPGTEGGGMITKIGNYCLLMMSSHVAHDCKIGDYVILVNHATLGGHVEIGDYAIVGGLSGVHQFVRIGEHAMIGGMSAIDNDVIPFGTAKGERASLAGLNIIGMKRRNFERETINALRNTYEMIFHSSEGTFEQRLNAAEEKFKNIKEVMQIINFIKADTSRAIAKPDNG